MTEIAHPTILDLAVCALIGTRAAPRAFACVFVPIPFVALTATLASSEPATEGGWDGAPSVAYCGVFSSIPRPVCNTFLCSVTSYDSLDMNLTSTVPFECGSAR